MFKADVKRSISWSNIILKKKKTNKLSMDEIRIIHVYESKIKFKIKIKIFLIARINTFYIHCE